MSNKTKFCQIIGLLRIEKVVYKRKRVPFIGRLALCYQTVVCLSFLSVCLSLTLVYCGQTVRRIKMKLGMQIGLGPGHIFGPCPFLLWPNGWMLQDAT